MRRLFVLASVTGAAFFAAAAPSALAMVPLKVTPKKPIVDDDVVVKFKVKKPLKAGWHYEASVIARSGTECASFVYVSSKRNPKKGKTMSMRLSPWDDVLNGGPEWCQGKATVMVSKAEDGDETGDTGSAIGIESIRFYAKP